MKILIINGANLNLLGSREPNIYGNKSMGDYIKELKSKFPKINFVFFQSNYEGQIIDRLQQDDYDAIIINPGAFTHYSYSIADALKNISTPKVEVHISNIYQREEFRKKSVTAAYTHGVISGFGLLGYELAVISILNK